MEFTSIVSGVFLVERFKMTNSTSLMDMDLFLFSISSCVHFDNLQISWNLTVWSELYNYWHKLIHNVPCRICCLVLSFLVLIIFFLFVISLAKGLSVLLVFSKSLVLVSLISLFVLFLCFWFLLLPFLFLLFTLDINCPPFSSFLRLRSLFLKLSSFKM